MPKAQVIYFENLQNKVDRFSGLMTIGATGDLNAFKV